MYSLFPEEQIFINFSVRVSIPVGKNKKTYYTLIPQHFDLTLFISS